jgi:hypothetical protein
MTISVEADATTSGTLTVGETGSDITSGSVTLSADATNGGTFAIIGGTAAALTVTLDGTGDIQANSTAAGDYTITFDGTASAVTTTTTAITALTFDASSNSGGVSEAGMAYVGKVNFKGSSGVDNVDGAAGADTINGNNGADMLDGAAGADTINGGSGDDTISGGAGADQLTGGSGSDVFAYTTQGTFTVAQTTAGATVGGIAIKEVQTITLSGSFVAGEVISVSDGTNTKTYTVLSGDSLTDIAAGIVSAMNTGAYDFDATSSGAVITNSESVAGGADLAAQTASVSTAILKESNAAVTVTGTAVTGYDKITDFTSSDSIVLPANSSTAGGATAVAGASTTAGTTATTNVEVAAGGKVTFATADDTLAERVTAITADDTDIGDNEVAFFEHGGNTYIYIADDTDANTDAMIELTGVTGYTTMTISSGAITFA